MFTYAEPSTIAASAKIASAMRTSSSVNARVIAERSCSPARERRDRWPDGHELFLPLTQRVTSLITESGLNMTQDFGAFGSGGVRTGAHVQGSIEIVCAAPLRKTCKRNAVHVPSE